MKFCYFSFPGVGKPIDSYGPAGAHSTAKDDDDDFGDDLFGSDDESEDEDEEKKKRLEAYAAKKAKSKTGILEFQEMDFQHIIS